MILAADRDDRAPAQEDVELGAARVAVGDVVLAGVEPQDTDVEPRAGEPPRDQLEVAAFVARVDRGRRGLGERQVGRVVVEVELPDRVGHRRRL